MNLSSKCFPLGALSYENVESTTRMVVKLFEKNPFLAFLPNVSEDDNVIRRTLENIPGIRFKGDNVVLKVGTNSYEQNMKKLDKAYNSPTLENLEPYAIEAPFLDKYLHIIKKFKSPNAYINLLGPFTISQMLQSAAEEQMLVDKSYRKLFIQAVCVKALWVIAKIKEFNPSTTPIVILEEPLFCRFGDLKRENEEITVELVTNLFSRVVEKIKEAGALVAIQSLDKCDWKIPINAGVDIISFDAYNNSSNLTILPDTLKEFLEKGGYINWGIVPVMSESVVKAINADFVYDKLKAAFAELSQVGVPAKLIHNSALVSVQGNMDNLPLIFAEKATILANQVALKIKMGH